MNARVVVSKQVQRRSQVFPQLGTSSKREGKEGPDECYEHATRHACEPVRRELVEWISGLSTALRDLSKYFSPPMLKGQGWPYLNADLLYLKLVANYEDLSDHRNQSYDCESRILQYEIGLAKCENKQ